MNVLYLDHTSLVSGAQWALLDLVAGLPASVEPTVMCPKGPLADSVRRLGVRVVEFSGTSGSFRLHPRHTAKASIDVLRSARAVERAAEATGADVVHANSIRAGLIAGAARLGGGTPTVVHIHDALPASRFGEVVRDAIHASADAILTISAYTTDNFAGARPREKYHMLSNPLDTNRFDAGAMTREAARSALGFGEESKLVGLVAQITPWKGQDTAIIAQSLFGAEHPDARLLLAGETKFLDRATRYDNASYERWLWRLISAFGLQGRVVLLGEREDAATVMRALDVLVAPSWVEPFGRSITEAMALETAVVATNVGGPAEYIEHGVDGILVPPRQPRKLAVAVERLLRDPHLRGALARRGRRKVVERFGSDRYVSRVLQVYHEILR